MISISGGPSEGGSSSKHAASNASGSVALNAVAAQLGKFTSKFGKVMMPQPAHQTETFPEYYMAAIKCLQELEANNFDLDHLIALVDYFKSSTIKVRWQLWTYEFMDEINQCMFILPYMVANFDIYYGTGR